MTFPEWAKPGIYGVLLGAVAVSIIGFNWGGWTTSGNANNMAKIRANQEVTLAMVPVCLQLAAADPDRISKLATIREAKGYNRQKAIMAAGWATFPGSETPSRDLAEACGDGLELDAS